MSGLARTIVASSVLPCSTFLCLGVGSGDPGPEKIHTWSRFCCLMVSSEVRVKASFAFGRSWNKMPKMISQHPKTESTGNIAPEYWTLACSLFWDLAPSFWAFWRSRFVWLEVQAPGERKCEASYDLDLVGSQYLGARCWESL